MTKPNDDIDDDFADDEDELDNQQLDVTGASKLLSVPLMIFLLMVGIGVGCIPFLILYTVYRTTAQAVSWTSG